MTTIALIVQRTSQAEGVVYVNNQEQMLRNLRHALRECRHVLIKGMQARIGDVWPALTEPVNNAIKLADDALGDRKVTKVTFTFNRTESIEDLRKRGFEFEEVTLVDGRTLLLPTKVP